jgi:dTDP-4-amino-4,6-dideoxygalactose transaminase
LGDSEGAFAGLRDIIARRFGPGQVTLWRSGTSALEVALRMARETLGDPSASLVLPAYSCFDVATAAVAAALPIRFYDQDPGTLAPDMDALLRAMREGGRIVVAAPLFGFPVPWNELRDTAAAHGALLVEDAAQAAGSLWQGKPVGGFGDLTVLSFGRGKGWTGGGGGAVIVRDPRVLHGGAGEGWVRRSGGSAAALVGSVVQWAFGRPGFYGIPARIPALGLGETHYREPRTPVGIPVFSAALAAATAGQSERERDVREGSARSLIEAIDALGLDPHLTMVRAVSGARPGYLRLPVLLRRAHRLPRAEARALGVARGYPRPLPELGPLVRLRAGGFGAYPGARRLARELVTLPTHRFITPSVQARIVDLLESVEGKGVA